MKVRYSAGHVWRYIVSGLKELIKEGVFIFSEDGVRFRALDPSHVVMIDMYFPRESFSEYEVNEEIKVPLNIEELARVFRRAGKKDSLIMELAGDKLKIIFEGRFQRVFYEPLISLEYTEIGEIKAPFKVDIRLASSIFQESIKDIEPVGEILGLEADNEKLILFNEGETAKAVIELTPESGIISSIVEEPQRSIYSYEYIDAFLPVSKVADTVRIQFSSEMPLKLTYELAEGAWFTTYVAPRAE